MIGRYKKRFRTEHLSWCQVFFKPVNCFTADKEELIVAGDKALLHFHGARYDEFLLELRKRLFILKVASAASFVHPERLPPAIANYHYHRIYIQMMERLRSVTSLVPEDWG